MVLVLPMLSADIGPKPTADIVVYYEGQKISEKIYVEMVGCSPGEIPNFEKWNRTCYETFKDEITKPEYIDYGYYVTCYKLHINRYDEERKCNWTRAGMVHGTEYGCPEGTCHFTYFLPDQFYLTTYVPSLDTTFLSNEITRESFNADFQLNLNQDGSAIVFETTPFLKTDLFR